MPFVNWTQSDKRWQGLTDHQKAAAMAIMEADGRDPEAQANILHAIINRANKGGEAIGAHVSRRIYQPVIEPAQQARLGRVLQDPRYGELAKEAEAVSSGSVPRRHAETHYLAPERVMLGLEAREPNKYKSWRKWTGFDPATNSYRGVAFRDNSHAFLSPEGRYNGAVLASGSVPAGQPPAGSPAPGAAPAQPPRGPFTAVGGGAGTPRQPDQIASLLGRLDAGSTASRGAGSSPDPIASLLSRMGDSGGATQGAGDGAANSADGFMRRASEEASRVNAEYDRQQAEIIKRMLARRQKGAPR
jgi:hypothetical protein